MAESQFTTVTQIVIWAVYLVLMVPYVLTELGRSFAKLHIVPEGIAATLFGKTLRQIPRYEIRSFAGIRHKRKSIVRQWIAVSDAPVAELSQRRLNRWAGSLLREIGLSKSGMYLIEWSPERLELLLDMYPGTPWTDLTENGELDAEHKNYRRAGSLTPPTRWNDSLGQKEEPSENYHVIASRKAAWQSPAGMYESVLCTRRFPRPAASE